MRLIHLLTKHWMMTSLHIGSRPVSGTNRENIRGISIEIEQIKERRRSGKRPFRTYHKSARSLNFTGTDFCKLVEFAPNFPFKICLKFALKLVVTESPNYNFNPM